MSTTLPKKQTEVWSNLALCLSQLNRYSTPFFVQQATKRIVTTVMCNSRQNIIHTVMWKQLGEQHLSVHWSHMLGGLACVVQAGPRMTCSWVSSLNQHNLSQKNNCTCSSALRSPFMNAFVIKRDNQQLLHPFLDLTYPLVLEEYYLYIPPWKMIYKLVLFQCL